MIEKIRKLVRPFIAVSFVLATLALFVMGKLPAEGILQTTGIIVGFYFGERAALKEPNPAEINGS